MIDAVADIEGCAGASRLVCKSDWDYKFILKFENLDSMQDFMANDHARVMDVHLPRIKSLAVDSKVHEQNFVCAWAAHTPVPSRHAYAHARRARALFCQCARLSVRELSILPCVCTLRRRRHRVSWGTAFSLILYIRVRKNEECPETSQTITKTERVTGYNGPPLPRSRR